ncbi:hypothetical protein QYM36_011429 [Artemia franciscana]|uniref:Uncharacterized protein n=1 Tax=Artemia franciscana TaxID=6661 RepID=A0AA88HZ07_ARTSF|nr:hypothetical protein QYM36_011429 [Artemia franciscana]
MSDNEEVNSSLIRAVREGDLEGAKNLINSFGLSYIKKSPDGYRLLCQALINKNTAIAKLLLNHDCKVNIEDCPYDGKIIPFKMIKNDDERKLTGTPLHHAVISAFVCQTIAAEDADAMAENTCREAELLGQYVRKDDEIAENRGNYVYSERDITLDGGVNSSRLRLQDKSISKDIISEVINQSPNKIVEANNVSKILAQSSGHCIVNADSTGDVIERKKKQKGHIFYMNESSCKNEFIGIAPDLTGTLSESDLEQSVCQNIRKGIDENLNQMNKNLENKNENNKDAEFRVKKKKKNILFDIFESSDEVESESSIFDKTKKGIEKDLQNMNVNPRGGNEKVSSVSSFMKPNESLKARYGKKKHAFSYILESSGDNKLDCSVSDQINKKTEAKSRKINHEILCCSKAYRCCKKSRLNGKKKKKNIYSFLFESSSESELEQSASEKIKKGTDISLKKEEKIVTRENNKPFPDSKCVTNNEGLGNIRKKKKRDVFSFILESVSDTELEPCVNEKNQDRDLTKADSQFERGNENSSFSEKCNKKRKKKRNFFRFLDDIEYETENDPVRTAIEPRIVGNNRKPKLAVEENARKKSYFF